MSDRISKAIILIGFVGVVWVTNVEPMTGGSWATATRQQQVAAR